MIYLQWQKKLPYFCEVTEEALKSKITLKVPPLCVTLVKGITLCLHYQPIRTRQTENYDGDGGFQFLF